MVTKGSGRSSTKAVNAISRPSGDHARLAGPSARLVRRALSPLSIQRTQSCGDPPSLETNARRPPSGDQRGEPSLRAPVVRARCSPPALGTSHRLPRQRSSLSSAQRRTYTIRSPSGEICGSEASSSWNRSTAASGFFRGASWAWRAASETRTRASEGCGMRRAPADDEDCFAPYSPAPFPPTTKAMPGQSPDPMHARRAGRRAESASRGAGSRRLRADPGPEPQAHRRDQRDCRAHHRREAAQAEELERVAIEGDRGAEREATDLEGQEECHADAVLERERQVTDEQGHREHVAEVARDDLPVMAEPCDPRPLAEGAHARPDREKHEREHDELGRRRAKALPPRSLHVSR